MSSSSKPRGVEVLGEEAYEAFSRILIYADLLADRGSAGQRQLAGLYAAQAERLAEQLARDPGHRPELVVGMTTLAADAYQLFTEVTGGQGGTDLTTWPVEQDRSDRSWELPAVPLPPSVDLDVLAERGRQLAIKTLRRLRI